MFAGSCRLLQQLQPVIFLPPIPFDWAWLLISLCSIMRLWTLLNGMQNVICLYVGKALNLYFYRYNFLLHSWGLLGPAILQSKHLMKLFQSWIPWVKSLTRTALWLCSCWGTTSLCGLLIFLRMEVSIDLILESSYSWKFLRAQLSFILWRIMLICPLY